MALGGLLEKMHLFRRRVEGDSISNAIRGSLRQRPRWSVALVVETKAPAAVEGD
jgi:hypothetical protein